MSTLQDRIEEIQRETGWNDTRMGKAAGVSRSAVSLWRGNSRTPITTIKMETALNLERATGYAARWIATGEGPKRLAAIPQKDHHPFTGSLRPSSVQSFTMPALLTTDALMTAGEVPDLFMADLPDDALAPTHPRGTRFIFKAGPASRFGSVVLVEDSSGGRHLRIYAQGIGGAWEARAVHPAYASLESARDGLRVVASEWAVITGD